LAVPEAVAVLGPTASGKSALGLALADRLDGEIVCCDSMQVYRGLDVGTAKASADDRRRRPHHLLDLVDPGDPFHAAAWARDARAAVAAVAERGRTPIIVGGTGLYYRALTRGLFDAPPPDPEIRARHQAEAAADGVDSLHRRLAEVDPVTAGRLLPGDLLRISRALEIYEQTGQPISERHRQATPPDPVRIFAVVLDPPTAELRPRIAARVQAMMEDGFLDEVRSLRQAGFGAARALQGIGYRQLGEHLDGRVSRDAAVAEIERVTVAYARRQRTWFRRERADLRAAAAPDPDLLASSVAAWLRGGA
jgi:tRNA dimethylallyltransferase